MKQIIMIAATTALVACATDPSATTGQQPDWAGIARDVLGVYGQPATGSSTALSDAQIAAGLREALTIGAGHVVTQLGAVGGFAQDGKIRIPLPSNLQKVDTALRMVGRAHLTQDLEARMNRAAEIATPKAKQMFMAAITQMTLTDVRDILFGGQQDAATQYFRRTMGAQLVTTFEPIVGQTLAEAGAIKAFDTAMASYTTLPLVGKVADDAKANLNAYVANKAVDGVFYYIAQEEAAIRQNPIKRTTELLKVVFGAV